MSKTHQSYSTRTGSIYLFIYLFPYELRYLLSLPISFVFPVFVRQQSFLQHMFFPLDQETPIIILLFSRQQLITSFGSSSATLSHSFLCLMPDGLCSFCHWRYEPRNPIQTKLTWVWEKPENKRQMKIVSPFHDSKTERA